MKHHPTFETLYKNMWADNGDFCSIQYAGTGALKTDYTRTGKRTVLSAMMDRYNSGVRYLKNSFYDGFRQDAINLFLGNYRVQDGEGTSTPCPLTVRRGLKYLALPSFLLLAIACCLMCLLIPSVYSMETFMYFFFWFMMIVFTLFAIVLNGTEFVDFPKLRDLRPRRRQD